MSKSLFKKDLLVLALVALVIPIFVTPRVMQGFAKQRQPNEYSCYSHRTVAVWEADCTLVQETDGGNNPCIPGKVVCEESTWYDHCDAGGPPNWMFEYYYSDGSVWWQDYECNEQCVGGDEAHCE